MGAPPPAAMHGVGMGPPPPMGPGMPPPPTGMGAMPTGGAANSTKQAADTAILALRELSSVIPQLGPQTSAFIDQIKAAVSVPAPAAPSSAPVIPGAPPPEMSNLDDSGSPGSM
jgi:hypothetical protein